MSVFLVGHLSDLHFAPLRNWYNSLDERNPGLSQAIGLLNQCIKAGIRRGISPSTYREVVAYELARYIHELKTQEGDPILDLLVVSGDLATIGEYCSSARAYLDGELHLTSELRSTLPGGGLARAVGQGLVVMPGNHDRYLSAPYLPGALNFEKEFNGTWSRYAPNHAVPHLSRALPHSKAIDRLVSRHAS